MAITRTWQETGGSSGVPVGAQIDTLLKSTNGCPIEVTRTEPTMYCAVMQGPFAAGGGGSAHPATTCGEVSGTDGMPDNITRGLTTVGCACPACEQRTVAP